MVASDGAWTVPGPAAVWREHSGLAVLASRRPQPRVEVDSLGTVHKHPVEVWKAVFHNTSVNMNT